MSHRIIATVTLAAVSFHVLLGCCWHHGHRCEMEVASVEVETCQCHGHSHSDDADDSSHHHDSDCCDGTQCNFYAPIDSSPDVSVSQSFSIQVAGGDSLVSVRALREICPWGICASPGIPLPEPLHALKQVWLI